MTMIIHFAFLHRASGLLAGFSAVRFSPLHTHFPTEFKDHHFQGFAFVHIFFPAGTTSNDK